MGKLIFSLVLSSLLLTIHVRAATADQACVDMKRFTCAPGKYDDGTGVAENSTLFNNNRDRIFKELHVQANSHFRAKLQKSENTYFRQIALSTMGLNMNPACEGADEKPSAACLDLLAEGAADLILRKISAPNFGYVGMINNDYKLQDEVFFTDSEVYREVEKELLEKAKNEKSIKEVEEKAKDKVFPQVKALLLNKIEEMVTDPATKKKMKDKVAAIRFNGTNCSSEATGSENIVGLISANAEYHSVRNSFKYCAGLALQNKSEFQMSYVIAHELAHSIDPCGITMGPKDYAFDYNGAKSRSEAQDNFPFPGVLQCLRSKKSIRAKFSAIQAAMTMPREMQNSSENDPDLSEESEPTSETFKSFCGSDQITESFSDWIAAEITPDYIEKNYPNLSKEQVRTGYSNVWRGMCEDSRMKGPRRGGFDVHPDQERRINYLLIQQPKIRAQMGCSAKAESDRMYCPLNAADIRAKNIPEVMLQYPAYPINPTYPTNNSPYGTKEIKNGSAR